jgi:flavodoxin
MNILNLYYSSTGNTTRVAKIVADTAVRQNHSVDTVRIKPGMEPDIDVLAYDLVFAGSGVYEWLPGKPVMTLFSKLAKQYRLNGLIQQPAERRRTKQAVVYCTYGGTHTGANEAVPTVKYMGQLFDHLGFELTGEWYIVGEFHGAYLDFSKKGKLGNITGRPNESDLQSIAEMVKGALNITAA